MHTITRIYGLVNPVSGEIFYVGRTQATLQQRLEGHKRDGRKRTTAKARYIKWIQWMGLQPEIVELDSIKDATLDQIHTKEQAYIDFYGLTRHLSNSGSSKLGGTGDNCRIDWNETVIAKLGSLPDWVIADELKCDRKNVSYMRTKLGIPACGNRAEHRKIPAMGGWNKISLPQDIIDRLGTMPDYKLAELTGFTKAVIARNRRALGILSYAEQTSNDGKAKRWIARTNRSNAC